VRRARARLGEADLVLALADDGVWPEIDTAGQVLHVRTKSDLTAGSVEDGLTISARTGEGIEALLVKLSELVRARAGLSAAPTLTRARHRAVLRAVVAELDDAAVATWPELRGEHLRRAMRELGRLTGVVDTEEVLGSIFSEFCIGK
jgi:tRNA modification GTPase